MNERINRWKCELVGEVSSLDEILEEMTQDAGQDLSGISVSDLKSALLNLNEVPWKDVGFGCAELLNDYYLTEREITAQLALQALYTALLLKFAIERGYGDWEFDFPHLITMLHRSKEVVPFYIAMELLSLVCETVPGVGP